jgi:hypothetical protein
MREGHPPPRRAWYTFGGLAGLLVVGAGGLLLLGSSPSEEGQALLGVYGYKIRAHEASGTDYEVWALLFVARPS